MADELKDPKFYVRGRTFHHKYKFLVEIEGIRSAAFSKCSELEAEIAKIEHYEGGALRPHKMPGRVTVPDITLERGACVDNDLYKWFKETVDLKRQIGKKDVGHGQVGGFRRNFRIIQLDRDDSELRSWIVAGAWPDKMTAGDWDNDADEVVIEKITLSIDWFEEEKNQE